MSAGRAHFRVEDLLALAGVLHKRTTLAPPDTPADKVAALRRHHALNPRAQSVRDPAFAGTNPFFDANDLVQVKYEMLRRGRAGGPPGGRARPSVRLSPASSSHAEHAPP